MKRVILLSLSILIVSSGYAQKTTLKLSSFKDLDVFGPFEIQLVKSDTEKMEIDFNGIDKDDIVYGAEKEVLRLKLKNSHYIDEWKNESRKSRYILVTVYYKDIDLIEASAGAVITSAETLKSKYLTIECTMGAEVTLDIDAQKTEAISNMGGVLKLSGQTDHLEVKANMGSLLKASQLEAKTAYVKANMGADVFVNVSEEFEASAGFGANVDYIGGPSVRHTSKNFGGEVNKRGN